jgi:hypothetical protein
MIDLSSYHYRLFMSISLSLLRRYQLNRESMEQELI